jgi:hypothetical protein
MKKFVKLIGIVALAAIIGFSMAACGDDGGGGPGPTGGGDNGGNGGGGGGGKVTITNFAGSLNSGKYVYALVSISGGPKISICNSSIPTELGQVSGSSITLSVFDGLGATNEPYTGSATIPAGYLYFYQCAQNDWSPVEKIFENKRAITFTNGNATIDFNNDMELLD